MKNFLKHSSITCVWFVASLVVILLLFGCKSSYKEATIEDAIKLGARVSYRLINRNYDAVKWDFPEFDTEEFERSYPSRKYGPNYWEYFEDLLRSGISLDLASPLILELKDTELFALERNRGFLVLAYKFLSPTEVAIPKIGFMVSIVILRERMNDDLDKFWEVVNCYPSFSLEEYYIWLLKYGKAQAKTNLVESKKFISALEDESTYTKMQEEIDDRLHQNYGWALATAESMLSRLAMSDQVHSNKELRTK